MACGGLLIAAVVSGCTDELGPCDMSAADQLVYSQNRMVATKGQALLHDSCGNAAFCHSSAAQGDARFGAPAELDFDMLPRPSGWPLVFEHRRDIWTSVLDGTMPPGVAGESTLGNNGWSFDLERQEDAEVLPSLSTAEGKGALRNWLACGAPVVAQTGVPAWALPRPDGGSASADDWSDIFARIIKLQCSGCHVGASAGGLVLAEECEAYAQLLDTSTCQGMPRLTPADTNSYLLDKLESNQPRCGDRMPPPPLNGLSATEIGAIRAWIEAGAKAANCGSP